MIRFWNEHDIEKIERIEKDCFKTPWNENMLKSEYVNPLYKCIVYDEGDVLGYLGFFVFDGQVDIGNIAVTLKERKTGIAKKLIIFLIDFCKEESINNLSLEVREGNVAAINLYKGFGFTAEGVRKNYYEDGENALIMWLRM